MNLLELFSPAYCSNNDSSLLIKFIHTSPKGPTTVTLASVLDANSELLFNTVKDHI